MRKIVIILSLLSCVSALGGEKQQKALGKTIVQIYTDLSGQKTDRKKILQALKGIKKNDPLGIFKGPLELLSVLSKEKKGAEIAKKCSFDDKGFVLTAELFFQKIKGLCHRLVLESLIREKKYNKLDSKTREYIEKNIVYFLDKDHADLFFQYLKKIKKDSGLHLAMSKITRDGYMKHNREVHPHILSSIQVGPRFTSYIQANRLMDLSEAVLFNEEFYQMKNSIDDDFEKNNLSQAKSKTGRLLGFHKESMGLVDLKRTQISLMILGKKFARKEDFKTSWTINQYLLRNTNGRERENIIFEVLFNLARQKKYEDAVKTINRLNLLKDFEELGSRLQYRVADSIDQYGQRDMAETLYKKIIETNPLSFYAVVAFRKNLFDTKEKMFFARRPLERTLSSANSLYKDMSSFFKRVRIWLAVGHRGFTAQELNGIFQHMNDKTKKHPKEELKYAVLKLGEMVNQEGGHLHTFQFIYKMLREGDLSLDDAFLKLLFPSPYSHEIKKFSLGRDPDLILSLVRQESAFDPNALSSAGARGLMQLMPSTARRFQRRIKKRHLARPSTNLKIGIKYLSRLIKKYDGNLIYALAAYNAGERRVKDWRKNIFKSGGPLETIEMIPFLETRDYVKLIYRNLFFYKYITGQDDFISKDFQKSFIVES